MSRWDWRQNAIFPILATICAILYLARAWRLSRLPSRVGSIWLLQLGFGAFWLLIATVAFRRCWRERRQFIESDRRERRVCPMRAYRIRSTRHRTPQI